MAIRRRAGVGHRVLQRAAWTRETRTGPADEPLLKTETVDVVRQAIKKLPAEQQKIVRMRIYEEKTFATIAEELDIPLGTALGRMRAAVSKLKQRLQDGP